MAPYNLDIQGWMSEEELAWLHDTAAEMSSVAEIGSWKGRSTYALLAGCKGNVFAVDHWQGSVEEREGAHAEATYCDIFSQFEANVGHFPNLSVVKMESSKAALRLPSVDMVFIDGDHTYEAVATDIRMWRPKAKRLICGHDGNFDEVAGAVAGELGSVEKGPGSLWFSWVSRERRKPKVTVCLPGSLRDEQWLEGWDRLHAYLQEDFRVTRIYSVGNNIYDVRNACVERLVDLAESHGRPDYVLWVDSDNIVDEKGFRALRHALDNLLEASAVGAWYLMKTPSGQAEITAGSGGMRPDIEDLLQAQGALLPVEYIGFGFLLMRYSLIEDLGLHPFLPHLRGDNDYDTDDVSFCLAAGAKGHKFFLHSGVHSPHLKLSPVPFIRRPMTAANLQEKERILTP